MTTPTSRSLDTLVIIRPFVLLEGKLMSKENVAQDLNLAPYQWAASTAQKLIEDFPRNNVITSTVTFSPKQPKQNSLQSLFMEVKQLTIALENQARLTRIIGYFSNHDDYLANHKYPTEKTTSELSVEQAEQLWDLAAAYDVPLVLHKKKDVPRTKRALRLLEEALLNPEGIAQIIQANGMIKERSASTAMAGSYSPLLVYTNAGHRPSGQQIEYLGDGMIRYINTATDESGFVDIEKHHRLVLDPILERILRWANDEVCFEFSTAAKGNTLKELAVAAEVAKRIFGLKPPYLPT
jgi:hypothetical protein